MPSAGPPGEEEGIAGLENYTDDLSSSFYRHSEDRSRVGGLVAVGKATPGR
jgi:hypothetical protein